MLCKRTSVLAGVSSKQLVGEIMEFKASLWQLCAKNVFSQKAKWCAITCFKYHSHCKKSQKKKTREPICFSNYTRSWYEQKLYFMLMSSNLNNSNPLQISKLFLFCLWAIVSAPNTTDCYKITSNWDRPFSLALRVTTKKISSSLPFMGFEY